MRLITKTRELSEKASFAVKFVRKFSMPGNIESKRGAFIVFEGCDRAGKTTQCRKLVDSLNKEGIPCKMWRFPDRETAIGSVINDYLTKKCELEDHAVHLLFAANRWEAVPAMKKLLEEGTTLIVDRYSFSGVAFTAAKPGLDLDWCKQPEIGLPEPDAVFYLTLDSEEAAKRGSYGGERYEQTDFQKQVAQNYQLLKESNWQEIDASKSIDDLQAELKVKVMKVVEGIEENQMIKKLWMAESNPSKKRNLEKENKLPTEGATNGHSNGVSS